MLDMHSRVLARYGSIEGHVDHKPNLPGWDTCMLFKNLPKLVPCRPKLAPVGRSTWGHFRALGHTWVHFGNWGWFGIACPKLAPVVESKWGCFGATGSTMGQEWYKARSESVQTDKCTRMRM
jgi:hypothetical protein